MTARAASSGAAVALALALLAGAAGCSDRAETLNVGVTQRSVGRAIAAKVEPPVTKTTCPPTLRRGKGETFTCTVQLGGGAGALDVKVRQSDDEGALEVEPTAAVLAGPAIATQVKAALRKRLGRAVQVDCGADVGKVRPKGTMVTCTARDRSSRRPVKVTITDADGTLAIVIPAPTAD